MPSEEYKRIPQPSLELEWCEMTVVVRGLDSECVIAIGWKYQLNKDDFRHPNIL